MTTVHLNCVLQKPSLGLYTQEGMTRSKITIIIGGKIKAPNKDVAGRIVCVVAFIFMTSMYDSVSHVYQIHVGPIRPIAIWNISKTSYLDSRNTILAFQKYIQSIVTKLRIHTSLTCIYI